MKHFEVQPRLFLYIFLGFIFCTIIGTLSHEGGHIAVAKYFGYKTRLSYGSMHWDQKADRASIHKLVGPYNEEACNGKPFPGRAAFEEKRDEMRLKRFFVNLGGPLQTVLTGTIGFVILWYRRKKFPLNFNIMDWTSVFLAFFWIRQPCNLLLSLTGRIFGGDRLWFGGDERKLSLYLKIPSGTISVFTGITGLLIVAYVMLVMIPKKHRATFVAAGVTGGVTGFILWMDYLGPHLLP